ncbi:acyl-CoA thioesterase/bile acid-CoA:amino acid N-acyltransferase family protein [Gottfriedia sp. NPDC056225]|uniref:acyl-CoA thioesterase/bile acid-CoA:amino acid N-acyltransferase family protein n=1 Tax=Gottfriedia sp. NPDC056225 TaxID=3345751 RepID=UPI0035DD0AD6
MEFDSKGNPKIVVSAVTSMIDSPIDIQIHHLKPNQIVTLKASRIAEGIKEIHLESFGKFRADRTGLVNLNTQCPIEGTYNSIDGMGLFWSLDTTKIVTKNDRSQTVGQVLEPQKLKLSLIIDNVIVDEILINRLWKSNQINRISVREKGLVATFFSDVNKEQRPGIIIVGGSEGGINEYPAALLASHGFSVLALAYFGIEHLPKRLVIIPLEYVKTAIDWMKSRPEVKEDLIGIHGTSKGSELALLAGCYFSDIKAVVSLNGSAVSLSGIVPWSEDDTLPPSWTYNGNPIPYASPINPKKIAVECREMWLNREGNPFGKWYAAITSDEEIVEKATIPVEKINGPILLISGEEDGGDTVRLSQKAIERLNTYNFAFSYNHLIYAGAGHSIGIPYLRANPYNQGNKYDTAKASKDSWNKTVEFFSENLKVNLN